MVHAVSVYGVVGDCESNAALWEDVLHHLSGLGNAPNIVGVDYNFPLERLWNVLQAVLPHLLTRRLVDVASGFRRVLPMRLQAGGGGRSHTALRRAGGSPHRAHRATGGTHPQRGDPGAPVGALRPDGGGD